MKKVLSAFLTLSLLSLSTGVFAGEITVSAAASLKNAFTDIAKGYEKANAGSKVNLNFASSNNLLKQMQSGAPVDVFASADQDTMDKAEKDSLVNPATRRNFALNDLVLITRAAGLAKDADSLTHDSIAHIAVGTPESVPAGRYAKDSLTASGLWEKLAPKFIFGNNVRQVLSYVQQGEADAGFVYRTDALVAGDKVSIVTAMGGHKPVLYPIAAASGCKGDDPAKFIEYVLSAEGQKILAGYGFSPAK